jgi:hypothetical protein
MDAAWRSFFDSFNPPNGTPKDRLWQMLTEN